MRWCIIIAALFVKDRNCHQRSCRRSVRIKTTLTNHDVVDVFGNEIATAATADFGLEEERSEAIECHRVAATVVLVLLHDRNHHNATAVDTLMRWSLCRTAVLV